MIFSTSIPQEKNNVLFIGYKENADLHYGAAFFVCTQKICFPLLIGKVLGLPDFCGKAAPTGLAGEEKIILAMLRYFFLPGLAQKGNPRTPVPIKSGKHIPMGLFIKNLRIMKLQFIESISKYAVTLLMIVGILMLVNKGIMPIGMIVLLLISRGVIGFFFRFIDLIISVIFILLITGLICF